MNILVTGGAGFIGSHLVDRLLGCGHRVLCLDSFNHYYDPRQKRRNIAPALRNDNLLLVEGDVRDTAIVDLCFDRLPVDVVLHLAAEVGVRTSLEHPATYYDVNAIGTLRILESMRKHNVPRLIFASSSSVYGNNESIPFSESDPAVHPVSPYAASKRAGELTCYAYHSLYGFDVFCFRFFTVYGPRQRPEMAIHNFVRKILSNQPITMYGKGTMERDYTYVDDIVDGIVRGLERLTGFEVFNLGNSSPVSLCSLVSTIENLIGKKALIDWQPEQSGDVRVTYADISKASDMLGYSPGYSLEHGIQKFIEWFRGQERL